MQNIQRLSVGPPPIPRSDLRDYLGQHVGYEFSMLQSSAASLISLNKDRLTEYGKAVHGKEIDRDEYAGIVSSMFLESFVLHLRNIIDFFYFEREDPKRRPKKGDIMAEHFYVGMMRPNGFPPISDTLKNARRRADKELAHLTAERLPSNSPHRGWNYVGLLKEIGERLDLFRRFCDPELLDERVANLQYPWQSRVVETP